MTSIEQAKTAVNSYFSDRSRPLQETFDGLVEIAEEVETLLEALKSDMALEDHSAE